MALHVSDIDFEHREILLKNKPPAMLEASPKGTVPVLITTAGKVIDESAQIIFWCLEQHDPAQWLGENKSLVNDITALIERNDVLFKPCLDRYKYADRHPQKSMEGHRKDSLFFLDELETRLVRQSCDQPFLLGNRCSAGDIVVLSFIRQFAFVDKTWFDNAPYPYLQNWLSRLMATPLFEKTMEKIPLWEFEQPKQDLPTPSPNIS